MATPEKEEKLTKDELIIRVEKVPYVQKAKERIEELYNVMVEFDFVFKDKDGNDDQQWITIQGSEEGCKQAKDYIKSLSNPNESALVKFPPELFSALTDNGVWARLEKQSHAVLLFTAEDEVHILGADPLSVTLAMSALEDIINTFVSSDDFSFEPQSPGSSISKQGSLRLDQELRRLSSEDGSLIIDEDPAGMKDEVKRAILGCVIEEPSSDFGGFLKKEQYVDIQTGNTVLLPPEAFALPSREDTVKNVSSAELNLMADAELDVAISAGGIGKSACEDDTKLWTFAFDQGYSVTEIEEVFRQHGANLRTSEFLKALVRNRRQGSLEEKSAANSQDSKLLEVASTTVNMLNSKGFPTKLPAPPTLGEKRPPVSVTSTSQNLHVDRSDNRDESLPSDYVAQLHRDYHEEDNCQTDELKKRNVERRKILKAALDAEPEVHLNSKANANTMSPPKSAKKKGKKKKNVAKKSPTTVKVNSRDTAKRETDEEHEEAVPLVTAGKTKDVLPEVKGKIPVTSQTKSQQAMSDQPAFVPPQVEFTQWGSLKDDSLCRNGNGEKEPESMPWQVAGKKQRPKRTLQSGSQANIPGVSYPKVTLHTKSDKLPYSEGKASSSANNNLESNRRRSPSSKKGQKLDSSQTYLMPLYTNPGQSQWPQPVSASPDTTTNDPPPIGQLLWSQPGSPPNLAPSYPPVPNDVPFTQVNQIPGISAPTKHKPNKLRWIVIDGSNVAMSHGNGVFSCRGLQICVDFFQKRGHDQITVFVPQWRTRQPKDNYPIRDQEVLLTLKQQGILTLTPARRVQGKNIVCYDDRFILKLAETTDGIVVSNDNYRDLWKEKLEWREIIENRLLMYSFVGDFFMPPDDPLGQDGPTLDEYLSKPDGGPATYFPPHRAPGNSRIGPQNVSQLRTSKPGIQNAHNHRSAPNLAGGQYFGDFAQPAPIFSRPPPLMQQTPLWGQYPPPNMHWQQPPNISQNNHRIYSAGAHRMPNQGVLNQPKESGLKKAHSDVEITKWGVNGGDTTDQAIDEFPDTKKKGGSKRQQKETTNVMSQNRSTSKTTSLFKQLHDVFPDNEEKITRILENHPSECQVDKLSAYLLEIL